MFHEADLFALPLRVPLSYMTPTYADGWPNYNAPTGLILASHQTAMRTAGATAASILGHPVIFSGTVPAHDVGISKYHINTGPQSRPGGLRRRLGFERGHADDDGKDE